MSDKTKISSVDLRGRSTDELSSLCTSKIDELQRMRFKHAMGQLPKTHSIGILRREVARMLTILGQARKTGADAGKEVQ